MSVQAAMGYLRALRERRDLSQADIARAAGVESKQVYRWENGESEPKASGIAVFIRVVGGRVDDVMRLLLDEGATEDMGRALAESFWAQSNSPKELQEQQRERAVALIDELLADPQKLDRLLGYGDRLREE